MTQECPQHAHHVANGNAAPPTRTVGNEVGIDVFGMQQTQVSSGLRIPTQEGRCSILPLKNRAAGEATFITYPTHKVFQVSFKRNRVRGCPPPSEKLQPVSAVNLCSAGMCAARFGFDFNELAQPVSINPLSIIRLHALGQPEKLFGTLVLGPMSATVGGAMLQIALALFQQGGGTMAVPCKLGGIDRFEHERLQS